MKEGEHMSTNKDVVSMLLEYMDGHLEEDLNLEHIARKAGYSKYHLSRMFHAKVGCTIHQYVKNKRLEKAAEQLIITSKTIAEIAFISGYESQQSFTYAFKKLYLESPQVYRRNRGILVFGQLHVMEHSNSIALSSRNNKTMAYMKRCIRYSIGKTVQMSEVKVA